MGAPRSLLRASWPRLATAILIRCLFGSSREMGARSSLAASCVVYKHLWCSFNAFTPTYCCLIQYNAHMRHAVAVEWTCFRVLRSTVKQIRLVSFGVLIGYSSSSAVTDRRRADVLPSGIPTGDSNTNTTRHYSYDRGVWDLATQNLGVPSALDS